MKYSFSNLFKENRREYNKLQMREYRRTHPEYVKRENLVALRWERNDTDIYRKYKRVQNYSWRHGLSLPYLRIEHWNSSKIRVAREHNGRFISWKEVD